MAAITSSPDLFEPCTVWEWDDAAVFLVLEFTEDPGTRPKIISVEGFLTLRNLDRPPRDDESVSLEADVHVVLLDSWQVEDGIHYQTIWGLPVLYVGFSFL